MKFSPPRVEMPLCRVLGLFPDHGALVGSFSNVIRIDDIPIKPPGGSQPSLVVQKIGPCHNLDRFDRLEVINPQLTRYRFPPAIWVICRDCPEIGSGQSER